MATSSASSVTFAAVTPPMAPAPTTSTLASTIVSPPPVPVQMPAFSGHRSRRTVAVRAWAITHSPLDSTSRWRVESSEAPRIARYSSIRRPFNYYASDLCLTRSSRMRQVTAWPSISSPSEIAAAEQPYDTLSGGQQARFQVLLLELGGATLLLLDEPTDNLDLHSAEALETGLAAFEGTVLAVTHDRWFARGFDRFLVYGADGTVYESDGPVWDEARVARAR